MIGLVDNDVLHKLAAIDLLGEAVSALGIAQSDWHVLPKAKYVFGVSGQERIRRRGAERFGAEVVSRIGDFIRRAAEVDWVDEQHADFDLLAGRDGIDTGEMMLLVATFGPPGEFLLLTGDKRFLRALSSCQDCDPIRERIEGRVVCFEQIIQRIVSHAGLNAVRQRLIDNCQCDIALEEAMKRSKLINSEAVEKELQFCVAKLEGQCPRLLHDFAA